MKTCSACHQAKVLSDFYADKRRPDGLKSQCKTCHATGNIRTRDPEKHRVARRESMRRTRQADPQKFRERERTASAKRPKDERVLARRAVHAALRSGRLTRPDRCSRCTQQRKVTAHHPDYSKQLDVVWLCYECHANE